MIDLGNTAEELRRNCPIEVLAFLRDIEVADTENFEGDYGGKCYLVETDEDLRRIETALWSYKPGDNRYLNLMETAAPFDSAEWVPGGAYVNIFLATNNAGGNTYFIPREIAERNETVLESIAMTHEENSKDADNEA